MKSLPLSALKPQTDFLKTLQYQAHQQAKLNESRLLPSQLDAVLSLIGRFPWQTCLSLAVLTAMGVEVVKII